MSNAYRAVGWNRQKRLYDLALWLGVTLYLGLFIMAGTLWVPSATPEILVIRATGTCAILMLHIILAIGPLCRLFPALLPLLYNRRHFGVSLFVVALVHGVFCIVQFHGFGDLNPLVSLLTSPGSYESLNDVMFQPLGFAALVILFLMAATSHDFWLANLTAPVWKALHMLVYLAYALLIMHVVLGVLQVATEPLYLWILGGGMGSLLGLHAVAALTSVRLDRDPGSTVSDGWVETVAVADIPEKCAKIVMLAGERVAIFKYDGKISAVSNVCQHQNGPLGEGRIIDGCITCPWHGYQYDPATGRSPPPFTEKIPTFRVQVRAGRVWVDPNPLPAGSEVEPAIIATDRGAA